jgi:hypothetical protein
MSPRAYEWLIVSACLVAWLMTIAPAILFLLGNWTRRRESIFDLMKDETLELYYKRFHPGRKIEPQHRVTIFRQDFGTMYGRQRYVLPLLLLAFLAGWGLWGTAGTLEVWVGLSTSRAHYTIDDIALGAFLGALTWVISDNLGRFRTRDFTSHDVYNGVFRLLIAVPLGYSLGSFLDAKFKVTVAFLLGAFPTSTLFTIARRLGAKQLGSAADVIDGAGDSELEKLESVVRSTSERFHDEGIAGIAALAWTDPIDLTIRTNFEFDFVVDCISQALLWVYVQDDIHLLYVLSLRGAQEVSTFMDTYDSGDEGAKKTLAEVAARLKIGEAALLQTLGQVRDDPSTRFMAKIWEEQDL